MRVFLAASCSGVNETDRKSVIVNNPPLYLLETFYNGPKICSKVLNDVGRENFLMDSGAFTFVHSKKHITHKELDLFVEQQIQFINDYDIKYFFEMDVNQTLGLSKVEELRKRIEQRTQKQVIPVWHVERGVEYFKNMCKEYDYIAIGGMVVGKNLTIDQIKKLVTYARRKNVKVHGLGFTQFKYINEIPWYSVDSCTWSKVAFLGGKICWFNGNTIKMRPIVKNGYKLNLSKVCAYNFSEWIKSQKYMNLQRW